jgi:nitrite reductase (NADH) large subunit
MKKRRLIIVGNGMATCRLLDELVSRAATDRYDITVFGEEPIATYNRILLSRVLGGEAPERIVTKPQSWFEARGVALHTGTTVTSLDTGRKLVATGDGRSLRYDVVVLATGSQPRLPPIPGAVDEKGNLRPGVFLYRKMSDCVAMRAFTRAGLSAIVLGGGLLGLEAAKALSDAGLHVSVVHAAETLMNAQLDPMAGQMLTRQIERCGIFVRTGRTIDLVEGEPEDGEPEDPAALRPIHSVTLDDGKTLPADMLVLACGVSPRVDVARASGLPINKGIIVNDTLATEIPGVYALGECAEHRARTYGVVAPAWDQAAVLADVLTGADPQARYLGSNLYVRLKVAGVDVATMGTTNAELDTDDVVEVVEQRRSTYRKLVLRDGKLVGAMLVGNTNAAATLVQTFDRGDDMPADPLEALCPQLIVGGVPAADRTVCNCNKVTEAGIRQAIDGGCDSVEALGAATRAGTGCGSCKGELVRLLGRHERPRPPLVAIGAVG